MKRKAHPTTVILVTPQAPHRKCDESFAGGFERTTMEMATALSLSGAQVIVIQVTPYCYSVAKRGGREQIQLRKRIHLLGNFTLVDLPLGTPLGESIGDCLGMGRNVVVFLPDNGGPFAAPSIENMTDAAQHISGQATTVTFLGFPLKEIEFYSPNQAHVIEFCKRLTKLIAATEVLLFPSHETRGEWRETFSKEAGLLVPSFEPRARAWRPVGKSITCISRFGLWATHKNHIVLLEAFMLLRKRGLRIRCDIVGDDTDRLSAIIKEAGLENVVRLHGLISEQARLAILENTLVHVLPSAIEAYCYSHAEALSMGIRCVGCTGTPSLSVAPHLITQITPVRPCRFARDFGFNTNMVIEPTPKALADSIEEAISLTKVQCATGERRPLENLANDFWRAVGM